MKNKFKCARCTNVYSTNELLYAENPFNSDELICGCPHCLGVNTFSRVCEVEECNCIVEDRLLSYTCEYHEHSNVQYVKQAHPEYFTDENA